ncbi:MAG: paaG4 [Aeromicrobium sp.]|nr:paaG4 [Aeromicrobium sp.]
MTATSLLDDTLRHELVGGVLTISLNRPQSANAINPDQRNAIIDLLGDASVDFDVRAVVLRSNGKIFCAGADVGTIDPSAARHATAAMNRIMTGAQRLVASIIDCNKPVIAAVQGTAAGMGAHLAYASDLVVASEKASFIESFVLRGLVVDAGGAYLLPRLIGLQRAKELAFLGDKLSAADAHGLGLVNRVVAPDDLDATVDELAQRLAGLPTTSLSLIKKLFNASPDQTRSDAFLAEAMAQEIQNTSDDAAEGVRAFKEGRPPSYVGH